MSTIKVDNLQTTGGAGQFTAKAWVNFNGTGTVAIRASGSVSSITDNGTGVYTVNFTSSLTDADYSVAGSGDLNVGTYRSMMQTYTNNFASSSIKVNYNNDGYQANVDTIRACVSVFR